MRLCIASGLALLASCGEGQAPLPPDAPVVRRIDHVLVVARQADALFSLFADTLECPVVWPMSDHGGFASGGVSLGDLTLEIIRESEHAGNAAASRFTGLALEPEPLDACLPVLTSRGIAFGRRSPYRSGLFITRWTTVGLPGVSSEAMNVFMCEYGSAIRKDLPERRRRVRDELRARGGGPLSLDSAREVVLAARDPARARGHWQALLHPNPPQVPGLWSFEAGPGIRIVAGTKESDHIAELVLRVRSLAQARTFLRSQGLLGADEPDQISLVAPDLGDVVIRLVAAESADTSMTTTRD